jgi:arylsulfatase A-like enzyme/Tfp pilus assembly protein PilF
MRRRRKVFPAPAAALAAAALLFGGCDRTAMESNAQVEAPPGTAVGRLEAGTDVVLITIDTLRADSVGFAGKSEVATPVMDRLARAGRVFTAAHAHNVVTLPSHTNLLTGRYAFDHGVRDNSGFVVPPTVPTLATALKEAGYVTGAFVAAFPLDARYGLNRGFDVYDDEYPIGTELNQFKMSERRGDEVIARALAWWRGQAGRQRFLWVHLYDPHAPYSPPEPFATRYAAERYHGEIAATDSFLAPLLEPLLDGREEPTLVVLTSDHGEGLGDHGELTHGLFAYESTLHVPLVIWGPGVAPGVEERTVGHVDVFPTLARALGLPLPDGLPGRSLLDGGELAGRRLYFEALSSYLNKGWAPLHGLLRDRAKYIHLPLPELYDLAADPVEKDNRIDRERRVANELKAALPAVALAPPARKSISAEESAGLRALGYLASGGTVSRDLASITVEDDPKRLVALDNKLHEVVAQYSSGRFAEAERLAREVVAERPSMANGYEYLATVLKEQGRTAEAVEVLEQALKRGVDHPTILRQLGLGLSEVGRAAEAIELLRPAESGEEIEALNALGAAFFTAGRLDDADRVYGKVLRIDPGNTRALESLGSVELGRGRPAEARAHLERALRANPSLPIAWNSLGVARQFLGDTPGALEAWQKAVDLDPNAFDALYNLGLTAASAGRTEVARRALQRYVTAAPPTRYREEISKARQVLIRLGVR